ncbi:MAG: nicotinate-nucleotide--dimethylbenzimidazole phosphoribosyltransferase [Actinomycetota bacterium]|nr:nicotinate-nucleotide--dimethylbenzimidazole phosphoribosyltransferase [Actinomycetota bacterium]
MDSQHPADAWVGAVPADPHRLDPAEAAPVDPAPAPADASVGPPDPAADAATPRDAVPADPDRTPVGLPDAGADPAAPLGAVPADPDPVDPAPIDPAPLGAVPADPDPVDPALADASVGLPDAAAEAAARDARDPAIGRLGEAAVWAAAVQGAAPAHPFRAVRVVAVAADHGIAAHGVSVHPPAVSARRAREAAGGSGVYARLALAAGASLRVVDAGLDTDPPAETAVRRGSGVLGAEDVLTREEAAAAFRLGRSVADAEIDGGADLLVPAVLGVGASAPAAVLVSALCDQEPAVMTGRGSGIDDNAWMRKCVAVRDGLRRARTAGSDPIGLLAAAGGADLAAVAGMLLQAAVRRTPVLLDGVTVLAAALVAQQVAVAAPDWWYAPHDGGDRAERAALNALHLTPVTDLGMRLGDGTGALVVLPLLQTALDLQVP